MKHATLAVLIFSVILLAGCSSKDTACFRSGKCLNIEIAVSAEDQKTGLMKYDSISEDYGMLFLNSNDADRCMWMKNMKFPIDIVWLDENGFILHIEKNVPECATDPCKIYCVKARNVLELKAGFAKKYGLENGQKVELNIKK